MAAPVLTRHALLDKLVGDEVMALYLPVMMDERWEDQLVADARERDFTALGDVVNTAARLQAHAQPGQVVRSERLFRRLAEPPAGAGAVTLELRGKQVPEPYRVLALG